MARILITGAAGFLGQKLAGALSREGRLRGRRIDALILTDLTLPAMPVGDVPVDRFALDLADPATVDRLAAVGADVIFHLAAMPSARAEADFDAGRNANLHGTLHVFEAARLSGTCPRVVFSSTSAVHGGDAPDVVTDGLELTPQTSYGAQKAMAEVMLNDMTRRGFLDGCGLRLATITIRAGVPSGAASAFLSAIFREPLSGRGANCPVSPDYAVWHTSPRQVVANLCHAAGVPGADFGANRNLNLPGRTDTIAEMVAAMTRVAGPEPARRITWTPDPAIAAIVTGWRNHFRPEKALSLGFTPDRSFEDSLRWYLEDDHEKVSA